MARKCVLFLFLGLIIVGCESDEDNDIATAQECLNNARSASEAQACRNSISQYSTESAYMVMCAADFIIGGITSSDFATAFAELRSEDGTTDPMAQMMGTLVMDSSSLADTTISDCQNSGLNGMYKFATLAKVATTFSVLGSSTDIETAINNIVGDKDALEEEEIGNLAPTVYNAYCSGDDYNEDQDEVCGTLQTALAEPNSEDIGECLAFLLEDKTRTSCP